MRTIDVNLGSRSYPVILDSGSIGQIGDFLRERFEADAPVVVVTNENVARIYADSVECEIAEAGFKVLPVFGASPAEKASPAPITMRPAARGRNTAFMLALLRLWLLHGKRGDHTPAAR